MTKPWLLKLRPPGHKKSPSELLIWWAVTRQAAHDLLFSYESNALDGLEFLSSTGCYIVSDIFGIDDESYKEAVGQLVVERERRTGVRLPIELLRRNNESAASS